MSKNQELLLFLKNYSLTTIFFMKIIIASFFLGIILSSCGEKQNVGPRSMDNQVQKIKGQGDTVGNVNSGSGG